MKKIICLVALICCFCVNGFVYAGSRSNNENDTLETAQQGNATINFARSYYAGLYVEVQHVIRDKDNYTILHIQSYGGKEADFQRVEIQSNKGKTFFVLQPSDVNPAAVSPEGDCNDHWYNADDLPKWVELSKKEQLRVAFYNDQGKKIESHNIQTLLNRASKLSTVPPPNAPITYGPMYSVFFPGKKWTDIKDAFVYYLENTGDNWYYTCDTPSRSIGIGYYYHKTDSMPYILGNIKFIETSTGTWLNLDIWENTGAPDASTDHYIEIYGDYSTKILNAIQKTYDALLPYSTYGITINDLFSKPIRISSVNVQSNPELACINKGDQVIKINSKDVSQRSSYSLGYLIAFSQGNPDLHLTLMNKQKGIYDVIVKGQLHAPDKESVDYAAATNIQKHIDSKYELRIYQPDYYAPFEIFDPKGPQDVNLESPYMYNLFHDGNNSSNSK